MRYVLLVLLAVPLLAGPHRPSIEPAASTPAAPSYSAERLAAMRDALAAQITVYDAAEQAARAASPAEAATLAITAAPAEQPFPLPGGGVALRVDGSQLSAAVAYIDDDGSTRVTHGGLRTGAPRTEGSHVR